MDITGAVIAVVSALIGAAAAFFGSLFLQQRVHQQEKERLLWSKRAEKLVELEGAAGFLVGRLARHGRLLEEEAELTRQQLIQIDVITGSLLRYQEGVKPINEFSHSAGMLRLSRSADEFESMEEANNAINKLLTDFEELKKAIDKVNKLP